MIEAIWRDLRHTARSLGRTPSFAVTVIVTLALGIGANVAIFSLVEHTLFRPLPVPAPKALVNLSSPGPKSGGTSGDSRIGGVESLFSYALFRDLEKVQTVFVALAAHVGFDANVSAGGDAARETGWLVSGGYFPALGLRPALGRLLTAGDDRSPGAAAVAVISHEYWRTRFNGDRSAIGKRLIVNGHALTIVGVAPAAFVSTTLDDRPQVFVPLTMVGAMRPGWDRFESRREHWLYLFGRLKPGVTRAAAERAINGPFAGILRDIELPAHLSRLSGADRAAFVHRQLLLEPGAQGQRGERDELSRMWTLLLAVTAIVLTLACANVANLLLARGAARAAEMKLRQSLGASRAQVVRYLLVESSLLSVAGGAAGLLCAAWALSVLTPLVPGQATFRFAFSLPVLGMAAMLAAVTAAVIGLYPALDVTRAVHAGRGATAGPSAIRFRVTLTTAQIALSLALLAVAGSFAKSLGNISRTELGVRVSNLLTFRVSPELSGYEPGRIRELTERLRTELAALPGVQSTTASSIPLFTGYGWSRVLTGGGGVTADANLTEITPGYFETLGIPLLAGREFLPTDAAGAPKVAIINEALMRQMGLGAGVVGRRLGLGVGAVPLDIEIVGVARDAKYSNVKEAAPPQFYLPIPQVARPGSLNFYVSASGPVQPLAGRIGPLLQQIDPTIPVENLRTLEEQVYAAADEDRTLAMLAGLFATVAVGVAAVGLFGMLWYSAARRRREFGVRAALGATPGSLRRLILAGVGRMVIAGGFAGAALALVLERLARSMLYGVNGPDYGTLGTAAAIIALVAFAAATGPALRAGRTDPAITLRDE